MNPELPPPKADRRRFNVTVRNAVADEFQVTVDVRMDLRPEQYTGWAIIQAQRYGMPPEKPYRVGPWEEVAT